VSTRERFCKNSPFVEVSPQSVFFTVKGLVRDDNKGAKVEFAAPLIWYSNPSTGESEPRVPRKEEREPDSCPPGRLW
jgi:hypothetical protein